MCDVLRDLEKALQPEFPSLGLNFDPTAEEFSAVVYSADYLQFECVLTLGAARVYAYRAGHLCIDGESVELDAFIAYIDKMKAN